MKLLIILMLTVFIMFLMSCETVKSCVKDCVESTHNQYYCESACMKEDLK
jgi:hypothetical protein